MTGRRTIFARRRRHAGFTLVEALTSLALMSLMLVSLGAVTGQWLPNWHRGFGEMQRLEILDVGLQRIVADIEAAEFVTVNGQAKIPLFIGDADSILLVRTSAGQDAAPHLEFVRLAETSDDRGVAMVRTRAAFAPLAPQASIADQIQFGDPVALVRAPYRISFVFAGPDGLWRETWRNAPALPNAVGVQVRDAATGALLAVSTAAILHVDLPVDCLGKKSARQCLVDMSRAAQSTPAQSGQ